MAEHTNPSASGSGVPIFIPMVIGIALVVVGATVAKDLGVKMTGLELNFGKTIAMLGAFLAFAPLIRMFYTKPLMEAIDERNTNLESTFQEAESLRDRMTDLKSSYEQKLAQTEMEARQKIQDALAEAQEMRSRIIDDAKTQAEQIKEATGEELRREREKMLLDLRSHVVDLTMTATRKVIGESVDEAKQRELVERFIDTAEVGR